MRLWKVEKILSVPSMSLGIPADVGQVCSFYDSILHGSVLGACFKAGDRLPCPGPVLNHRLADHLVIGQVVPLVALGHCNYRKGQLVYFFRELQGSLS